MQPDSAVAYNNICSAYNQLQQWDKAIEACQQALAIDPDFTSWRRTTCGWPRLRSRPQLSRIEDYLNDSVTFYNVGDYQKSVEAAQSALQLQPELRRRLQQHLLRVQRVEAVGPGDRRVREGAGYHPGFRAGEE